MPRLPVRRTALLILALLTLALQAVGCDGGSGSAEAIATAQAALDARTARFIAATEPYFEGSAPALEGPCPGLEQIASPRVGSSTILSREAFTRGSVPLPSIREAWWEVAGLAGTLERGERVRLDERQEQLLTEIPGAAWWADRTELLLVASTLERPEAVRTDAFRPGRIEGWLFLWSHAEGAIRCAGPVSMESRDTVVTTGGTRALEDQLNEDAYQAALAAMQAVR